MQALEQKVGLMEKLRNAGGRTIGIYALTFALSGMYGCEEYQEDKEPESVCCSLKNCASHQYCSTSYKDEHKDGKVIGTLETCTCINEPEKECCDDTNCGPCAPPEPNPPGCMYGICCQVGLCYMTSDFEGINEVE